MGQNAPHYQLEKLPPLRNCGKFTLTFRKKFYLYQKIIGTEVRNFEDRQNVM